MLRSAKDLLSKINDILPPSEPRKHNITINDDGDLVVTLAMDKFYPFKIEDKDLLRLPESIALEIVSIYKEYVV